MCGIVGLYYRSSSCEEARLTAMRESLAHRGPDDAGNYVEGPLGIAQRRLSIIDLGGGHQPMFTEDGRYAIVFNGEIYNYRELKQELESQGVAFRSGSDTEVILRLHVALGDEAVARLNGIFAYALWDKVRRRLLLARDRAGIKPLYFSSTPQGMAFASEIKALFLSDIVSPRLNTARVAEYLMFRHVAGEDGLFAGVASVPPGHTLEVLDGRPAAPQAYWSFHQPHKRFEGSFEDAVNALDDQLNKAVARQMVSDVPLGTFCSGGIDSSLTTAIASRHASKAINTFSVGFAEADFDESEYARMAATHCKTQHHELRIDEQEFAALLPKLVYHHDLPLNFANSVHIYAVSALARQHVTVVLTGEGADELFGGYPRYYIPRLLELTQKIPGPLRSALFSVLDRAPDVRMRKLAAFARRSADDVALYNNSTGMAPALALEACGATGGLALEFREASLRQAQARGLDVVSSVAALDFHTYLVSILDRQDKMSMAASIEARVPFLDNEIIDFARSLPLDFKQTFRSRKRVLKAVALRYLPDAIVHRRKSGFGVPLRQWFAGTGPMSKLLDEAIASRTLDGLVDTKLVAKLRAAHVAGQDHNEFLWGVLNLHLWREAFRA